MQCAQFVSNYHEADNTTGLRRTLCFLFLEQFIHCSLWQTKGVIAVFFNNVKIKLNSNSYHSPNYSFFIIFHTMNVNYPDKSSTVLQFINWISLQNLTRLIDKVRATFQRSTLYAIHMGLFIRTVE